MNTQPNTNLNDTSLNNEQQATDHGPQTTDNGQTKKASIMNTAKTAIFTLAIIAALALNVASAAPILLGGFDGNQTQNTISPATIFSNTGVRELVGAKQDTDAVGAVSTRIWTDQTTNKELQWSPSAVSTITGNWGASDFNTDASTANDPWVVTQQNESWINFEISNTGTFDVELDKFHISANRTSTTAPTTLTISLEQNGTFANPVVLSPSEGLTAIGSQAIALSGSTGWNGYEFSFSSILSDKILSAGETATFRIANNVGTARLYLDNIGLSGEILVPEPSTAILAGLGLAGLCLRRRRK